MVDATIRQRFINARGLRFHIAESGEPGRPLLLLLHGFPEFWYSWRHQLAALGDSFHCVAPDLRGYNETDKPDDGYDIDSLADDVAALIDELGAERAGVIGHDWGGAITWHFAQRHSARLSRFAVINCPPVDALPRAVLRDPRQLSQLWYMLFFQLPGVAESVLLKDDAARIARVLRANSVRRDAFSDDDLVRYREAFCRPGVARCALAYYRSAARRLARGLDSKPALIERPGLVIWGRDDPALRPELTRGLEARLNAPLTLHFLPGVGHFPNSEAPDEVSAALRQLFDS